MIPRVDWATRSFSLYLGHTHTHTRTHTRGLPWWLSVKKPSCNAGATGDANSISGLLGRSPGEGLGNPLQYSCLKSPMDRGAWWVTVLKVAETQRQLKGFSTRAHTHTHTHSHNPEAHLRNSLSRKKLGSFITTRTHSLTAHLSIKLPSLSHR